MAAELLAPKWFDKNPALSNEDNFEQLRAALGIARGLYLDGRDDTAFGRFARHYPAQIERAGARGLNGLVALYGPALIDRAAARRALPRPRPCRSTRRCSATSPASAPPTSAPTWPASTSTPSSPACSPRRRIAARHTVGLVDPITAADQAERVGDGLPETLEEVVAAYGQRWFKLKVAGDVAADVERLARIAGVLDRIDGGYRCSLDGNEQYDDVEGVLALWRRMHAEPRLARLCAQRRLRRAADQAADRARARRERPLGRDAGHRRRVRRRARRLRPRARARATAASPRRPARASTSR